MARGNQRDKAREKNQKEASAIVSFTQQSTLLCDITPLCATAANDFCCLIEKEEYRKPLILETPVFRSTRTPLQKIAICLALVLSERDVQEKDKQS